jgi:hypothetical protein
VKKYQDRAVSDADTDGSGVLALISLFSILFPTKTEVTKPALNAPKRERKPFVFDWRGATAGPFCASYYGHLDYDYCYSIGKDGWVPLGVAMCRMLSIWPADTQSADAYYDSANKVLRRFLVNRVYLNPHDGTMDEWLKTNEAVFKYLEEVGSGDRIEITPPDGYPFPRTLELSGLSLAEIYLGAVERVHPPAFNRRIVYADSLSPAYWDHPTVQTAINGARDTLTLTTELALTWFEVRGVPVDRDQQLVKADGYKAISDFVEDFF